MPEEVPVATPSDYLFAALQYVLPKHLLSRGAYALMRSRNPVIKNTTLRVFLAGYKVEMSEAEQPDPFSYPSFNDFFTRALKPEARPISHDPQLVVSPVDGTVSQCGHLYDTSIFQAKGHHYSLAELVGGNREAIDAYRDGSFACIYLAPYNYHRIHMPYDAALRSNLYVPGDLFSVNAATARAVPRVFARNERLICDFDTPIGRMAVISIGALFVGSIQTVHCGEVNPPPRGRKRVTSIPEGVGRHFAKGAELGRFNMGSTVVVLFQAGRIRWDARLAPQTKVRLGQPIGRSNGADNSAAH
jgi:phosphatidylserine decarboxylase